MLVGNYVLGFWGDKVVNLDPTNREGWEAGAAMFWLMPAAFAGVVAIIFFLSFWDKVDIKDEAEVREAESELETQGAV